METTKPRTKAFLIRLTEEEFRRMVADAKAAQQPVAWHVRKKLFAANRKERSK